MEAKEDASTVLGYACLPLLVVDSPVHVAAPRADDDAVATEAPVMPAPAPPKTKHHTTQLLADGTHLLSVAKTLPDTNYLDLYVDESPQIDWADKKPVFQCR